MEYYYAELKVKQETNKEVSKNQTVGGCSETCPR
jgi:hypothetical protein